MYRIRDWLYIGKYSQIRIRDNFERLNIGALLNLAEKIGHKDVESLYLPVADGEPVSAEMIEAGVKFIREQKAAGKRVTVACGAGISRSTLFTMAALMEEENLDVFEAFREVYKRHRSAKPHHELVISLAAYHGQEMDLLEVWTGLNDIKKEVDASTTAPYEGSG